MHTGGPVCTPSGWRPSGAALYRTKTRNGTKNRVQRSPWLLGFPILTEALRFKRQRRPERGGPSPCSPPPDRVTALRGMAGQLFTGLTEGVPLTGNLGLDVGQQQNQITVCAGRYEEPHQRGQIKSRQRKQTCSRKKTKPLQ